MTPIRLGPRFNPMIVGAALLLTLALGNASCSGTGMPMSPTGSMGGQNGNSGSYHSNGERIYFTATSNSGSPISYRGGPGMMGMMQLACMNCHRSDGHGGPVFMAGLSFQAADITWPSLTQNGQPPYTEDTVKRAITQGLDSDGQPLDAVMPRWSMSAQDLDDVVGYLKTLR